MTLNIMVIFGPKNSGVKLDYDIKLKALTHPILTKNDPKRKRKRAEEGKKRKRKKKSPQ